jgi:hypothetical protein
VRRRPDARERNEAGGQYAQFQVAVLLPGIAINTSPTDFEMIKQAQVRRFNGERYVPFGPVLSGATVS